MSNSTEIPFLTARQVDDSASPYGYIPTLWICALFTALFGLSTIVHFVQAAYYRLWFLFPSAVLAGIGETIGWAGRLWSSQNPLAVDPFEMEISCTIISPTPLVAANFVILGRVIYTLGPQFSRLSPKWYTAIFCSCDVIALVVQAIGGGSASAAKTPAAAQTGGNIMLAGIAFQLAVIVIYAGFASEFIFRYAHNRPLRSALASSRDSSATVTDSPTATATAPAAPPAGGDDGAGAPGAIPADKERGAVLVRGVAPGERIMLGALAFSTLVIFIRSVYRVIELAGGWSGRIIHTQVYFDVCDGAMIVLAFYTLNFFHPGRLLDR